jgi:hypothetical protein
LKHIFAQVDILFGVVKSKDLANFPRSLAMAANVSSFKNSCSKKVILNHAGTEDGLAPGLKLMSHFLKKAQLDSSTMVHCQYSFHDCPSCQNLG